MVAVKVLELPPSARRDLRPTLTAVEPEWEHRVRALVERGQVVEARRLLGTLPETDRVARWSRALAPAKPLSQPPTAKASIRSGWTRSQAAEYVGCWVLVDGDEVIDHDEDLTALLARHEPERRREFLLADLGAAR